MSLLLPRLLLERQHYLAADEEKRVATRLREQLHLRVSLYLGAR
jgi:hypothetical protein